MTLSLSGHRSPASAGLLWALAVSAALAGCTAPLPEGFSDTARPELGAPAAPLEEDEAAPPLEAPAPPAAHGAEDAPTPPATGEPALPEPPAESRAEPPADDHEPGGADESVPAEGAPSPRPTSAEARTVGSVTDPRGDHGLEGPAYADIVAVTITDDGTLARVMVDVAGTLPTRLASGEVMGVGVDLFHDPARPESDFQLFAAGDEDGWLAYLHTPQGFVEYPGAFRLGGRRIVFEVPWDAVGDPPPRAFRTFVDWSQRRLALNAVSQDFAPDAGTAPLRR